MSWTEYTAHATPTSTDQPTPNPNLQDATPLTAIESAPAAKLNELSTSELAPILDSAQRRVRFAPLVLCLCLVLFGAAFVSNNQFLIGLAALHTAVFGSLAIFLDRYRRSVKIDYNPDDAANKVGAAIEDSFADLKQCSYIWSIQVQGNTNDWKRHAGATKLMKRQRIYPQSKRPTCIRGNVSFPSITIGNDELYFLPDAMLIVESKSVAAMHYKDFSTTVSQARFIEEEALPPDANVVGQTWRYVNKSGGPDRRFNSNKQIPICLYGEMAFASPTGLNGILQYSNPSAGERFAKVTEVLHGFDSSLSQSKSVKSFRTARHWPSLLFLAFFLLSGLALGSASALAIPQARYQLRNMGLVVPPPVIPRPAEQLSNAPAIERKVQRDSGPSRTLNITPSLPPDKSQVRVTVPMPRPRPIP